MLENISPGGYLDLEQISRNNFKLFSDYLEIENISNCQTEGLKMRKKSPAKMILGSVLENDFWTPSPAPLLSILYMTIFKNVRQN